MRLALSDQKANVSQLSHHFASGLMARRHTQHEPDPEHPTNAEQAPGGAGARVPNRFARLFVLGSMPLQRRASARQERDDTRAGPPQGMAPSAHAIVRALPTSPDSDAASDRIVENGWARFFIAGKSAGRPVGLRTSRSGAAFTPELERYTRSLHRKLNLTFNILTDPHPKVAGQFRLVYVLPDYLSDLYKSWGVTLDPHDESEYRLPMPARYVIDTGGIIRSADVNADHTIRPEPLATLEILRRLAEGPPSPNRPPR